MKMFIFEKEIKYGNVVVEKSFKFAVRIIKFYGVFNKKVYSISPLLKQLLRSGTSVGANISEAQSAFTKKDFINKLGIALKESRETEYWLCLLKESEIINEKEFESIYKDCEELSKLLTTIIKSSKLKL
jgi:four helix bundle protein